MPVVALLLLAIPVLEIVVILKVGSAIGALWTVAALIAMAVAGAALARHQGFAAVRQVQESMATGRAVGRSLVEAALVLVAAVLMITPGFVTDAAGVLLLLPPVRRPLAGRLARWARDRVELHTFPVGGLGGVDHRGDHDRRDPPPPGVIDV